MSTAPEPTLRPGPNKTVSIPAWAYDALEEARVWLEKNGTPPEISALSDEAHAGSKTKFPRGIVIGLVIRGWLSERRGARSPAAREPSMASKAAALSELLDEALVDEGVTPKKKRGKK